MGPRWKELAAGLTASLHPTAPPIAITFLAEAPPRVARYDAPLAPPGPDGRTGSVPAGCVFWMRSTERTFSTVAIDHANCSVGSMTHGFLSPAEAATRSDVTTLVASGWVSEDVLPLIPRVKQRPGAVVYGPLAETAVDPDVVLLRLTAKSLMVLSDALPGLRIEGKPQCHIVASAKEDQDVVASVGCMLSRTRTGMPSSEVTCAIPSSRLAEVVDAVERTAQADAAVAGYAATDARRF